MTGTRSTFQRPAPRSCFRRAPPGGGSGEFENSLSPHIQLYNPSGVLVATGTVGADGRNETINYTPLGRGRLQRRGHRQEQHPGRIRPQPWDALGPRPAGQRDRGRRHRERHAERADRPASNLTVSLISSDPSRLTVPATVTIPAGQTSVPCRSRSSTPGSWTDPRP